MKRHLAAFAGALALAGAAPAQHGDLVERHAYVMGTRASLVTWDKERSRGLERLERALRIIEQTEAELSTWRDDSEVSALNRAPLGTPWKVGRSLCATLAIVAEWREATGGAFDPAVGRLTEAWGIHDRGAFPPAEALRRAHASSGFKHFNFDPAACLVARRADVTLDVGAFGKGEALDRVAAAVEDVPWLIDLGGQVTVGGTPPGTGGWNVAVAHPVDRAKPYLRLAIPEGSLSTSGSPERDHTVNGRRVGHILDPRTGEPAPFAGSVSVWHRRGVVADVLSTALYVMGPDEGLRWAEARRIAVCYLWADAGGRIRVAMTDAFRILTI